MPEPTKIPRPFAASGDKNSIPDSSGSIGFASWQEGFPAITGMPFAQGGVAPKRADFNGIFNALSQAVMWMQQGGVYAYDALTDYEVGNLALYSGEIYVCLAANGPGSTVKNPTDATTWAKIIQAKSLDTTLQGYAAVTSGTWTPILRGGATAGTMTYTTQTGQYVKIGDLVFVWGEVNGSFTTLPTGEVQISGLPFSAGTSRPCLINTYGRSGGVSNSVSRLVKAIAYNNYLVLQANAAAESIANGIGKVDYAAWDTSSNDGYKIHITSANNAARIYFAGLYCAS